MKMQRKRAADIYEDIREKAPGVYEDIKERRRRRLSEKPKSLRWRPKKS